MKIYKIILSISVISLLSSILILLKVYHKITYNTLLAQNKPESGEIKKLDAKLQNTNINQLLEEKKISAEKEKIGDKYEKLPLKIDYQFLVKLHIANGKNGKKNIEEFVAKNQEILIYPSIINVPIKIVHPNAHVTSMIPSQGQHYIEGLRLSEKTCKDYNNFYEIFITPNQKLPKLYFIKNLCFSNNDKTVCHMSKVVLKIENGTPDFIYQKGEIFCNKSREIINKVTAKETIKNWILQTTPTKEALHEATGGVESIYKFRKKMNKIYKGMFSNNEIGKKIVKKIKIK